MEWRGDDDPPSMPAVNSRTRSAGVSRSRTPRRRGEPWQKHVASEPVDIDRDGRLRSSPGTPGPRPSCCAAIHRRRDGSRCHFRTSPAPRCRARSAPGSPALDERERLARERAPRQIAAEDDRSGCSRSSSASTASSAGALPCTSASAATRMLPVGAACDRELVLGVLDPLLELPAVGVRLARLDLLQLRLRRLELRRARGRRRSPSRHGVVDERDRAVELDLEEARAGRELEHLVRRSRWIRVEPAFSVATSGAWRARTPISPAAPGTISISASPRRPRRRG